MEAGWDGSSWRKGGGSGQGRGEWRVSGVDVGENRQEPNTWDM